MANKPEENQVPPTPPTAKISEEDKVEVSRKDLSDILKRLDTYEADLKQKNQDIVMLRTIADQNRLDNYERRNSKGELIRTALLRRVGIADDAKTIIGWHVTGNLSYVDELNRPFSKQQIKVQYLDGSWSDPMDYGKFNKESSFTEPLDIVKRAEDEEGNTFFTLRMSDGQTLEVNSVFVN